MGADFRCHRAALGRGHTECMDTRKGIPRQWTIDRKKKGRTLAERPVGSAILVQDLVNDLHRLYPGSNATQEIYGWECRAWIPEPGGYDPEGDWAGSLHSDEALRKAAEAEQRSLLCISVGGQRMATRVSTSFGSRSEKPKQSTGKRLKTTRRG